MYSNKVEIAQHRLNKDSVNPLKMRPKITLATPAGFNMFLPTPPNNPLNNTTAINDAITG